MGDGGDETAGGVALDATLTAEDVSPGSSPDDAGNDEIGTGTRVDRYVVLDRVGAGGMGVVFAAYDPELDRRVALKFLHAGPRAMDDRARDRFRREAQAMARVSHRNVASVYDVGTYRGQLFLTMEFVEGSTLRERLDELGDDWRAKWELLRAAGEGLAAAHARDIVHRDFKPENVLVNEAGEVRVTDFGLAHALGVLADTGDETAGSGSLLDTPLTRTGGVLGTPKYMAPEQHSAARTTPATDQFAFCVVLYEALFGEHPFEGETAAELASAVVESDRRPAKTAPSIPASMRRALERGLSVVAGERFASMEALLEALDPDRTGRRRRRVVEVVAVVAVVGVAAFFALRPRGSGEPPGPDCHAYGDKLSEAWSDDRRSAVTAAFAAHEAPYASGPGTYFTGRIDAWAERWGAMYVDACESTHVRGEQSSELLDLRMQCLEHRLYDVKALVDVYAAGVDDAALKRATSAADSLPSLGRCDDGEALRDLTPLPDDPDMAARIEEQRRRVSETSALYKVGQYKVGAELAADVYAAARKLEFSPLVAAAALEYGDMQMVLGELDEAEELFYESTELAAASGDRELEAKGWNSLVLLAASYRERPDEAILLSRIARTALARIGGGHVGLEASLHLNLGVAYYGKLELQKAYDEFALAVDILERAGDTDSLAMANAIGNAGGTLRAMGKTQEALPLIERAMELRQSFLGERHPDVAASLSSACAAYGGLGAYARALELCERARDLRRAVYGDEHRAVSYGIANVADILKSLGRYEESIRAYERALELHAAVSETRGLFYVLHVAELADAQRRAGDLDSAATTLARASELWRDIPDQEAESKGLRLLSGRIALDRGDAAGALADCARSLELIGDRVSEFPDSFIHTQRCIGDANLALSRRSAAEAAYRAALELASPENKAPELMARLEFGLAQTTTDSAEASRLARLAIEHFERSEGPVETELRTAREWLAANGG